MGRGGRWGGEVGESGYREGTTLRSTPITELGHGHRHFMITLTEGSWYVLNQTHTHTHTHTHTTHTHHTHTHTHTHHTTHHLVSHLQASWSQGTTPLAATAHTGGVVQQSHALMKTSKRLMPSTSVFTNERRTSNAASTSEGNPLPACVTTAPTTSCSVRWRGGEGRREEGGGEGRGG